MDSGVTGVKETQLHKRHERPEETNPHASFSYKTASQGENKTIGPQAFDSTTCGATAVQKNCNALTFRIFRKLFGYKPKYGTVSAQQSPWVER